MNERDEPKSPDLGREWAPDVMGLCGERAYVTSSLGELGIVAALGSRLQQCDHVVPVGVQVEQPMLPIAMN